MSDNRQYLILCDHCGVDISIQPPRETGCNHVHYPEACCQCSGKASYTRTIVDFDLKRVTHEDHTRTFDQYCREKGFGSGPAHETEGRR